jgi:hypothetical protein
MDADGQSGQLSAACCIAKADMVIPCMAVAGAVGKAMAQVEEAISSGGLWKQLTAIILLRLTPVVGAVPGAGAGAVKTSLQECHHFIAIYFDSRSRSSAHQDTRRGPTLLSVLQFNLSCPTPHSLCRCPSVPATICWG